MRVSFAVTDDQGGSHKSLRNFLPLCEGGCPQMLTDSVFIEAGAEAHLRTYISGADSPRAQRHRRCRVSGCATVRARKSN